MDSTPFDPSLGASFRLVRRTDDGPAGEVWRGLDVHTGEAVTAYLLPPEWAADPALVSRATTDRAGLTGLADEAVVRVRDVVADGGRLALVTEHVEGQTLRAVIDLAGPLAPAVACRVVASVLTGLAAGHAAGLLHRGVRPESVCLTADWLGLTPGSVRLDGWGRAALVADAAAEPEQHDVRLAPEVRSGSPASYPADVYAAGVLLYELLSGRLPSAHRAPTVLDVPPRLWNLLGALMSTDPTRRPDAAAAADRLEQVASHLDGVPVLARPKAPRIVPHVSRREQALAAAPAHLIPDADAPEPSAYLTGPAPLLGVPMGQTMARPGRVPVPETEPEPEPTRTPWYGRWWVWLIVAVVLVAAVVGSAWLVAR